MKNRCILFAFAALVAGGCQSNPKPKATLERGWIGGEYRKTEGKLVPKGQRSAVYVKQVYSGTPAERAGLMPGDLILAIDERPVRTLKDFHRFVDAAAPGSEVIVRVRRQRKPVDLPVTIGRESYQQWHAFQIGLGFSARLDLWPNPEFSALPVAQYKHPQDRLELRSPEVMLAKQARTGGKGEAGTHSDEGWDAWVLVFGLNAHKQILKQEAAVRIQSESTRE